MGKKDRGVEESAVVPIEALNLIEEGFDKTYIGRTLGLSRDVLNKALGEARVLTSALSQYDEIREASLTDLQVKTLLAITPEKVAEADFSALTKGFKVLFDAEMALKGKPSSIQGLASYVVHLHNTAKERGQVIDCAPVDKVA